MSEHTLPRYAIIGPPFIGGYRITDDWKARPGTVEALSKTYQSRSAAEKDCKLLNSAQAILSGEKP